MPPGCLDSNCCDDSYNKESQAVLSQYLYLDTYERMSGLAMEQLTGNVSGFVKYRANDALVAVSNER